MDDKLSILNPTQKNYTLEVKPRGKRKYKKVGVYAVDRMDVHMLIKYKFGLENNQLHHITEMTELENMPNDLEEYFTSHSYKDLGKEVV